MEITANYLNLEGNDYLFAFVRDITERKRVEEVARASRQQLADIIDFLPDATFVIDRDRRVIAWNKAIERMTGVSKAEILGQGDYAYAVPFYGSKRPILIDMIGRGDAEVASQYQSLRRDGETLFAETFVPSICGGRGAYVWAKASPLYDQRSNLAGAIEAVRDVTEQKKAEEALRESEEKFRAVFHNANDVIVLNELTPDGMPGRFIEVNDLACTRLGYSREEFLEMTPADIGLREFIDRHPELLQDLRSGKAITFEITLVSRGGVQIPTEISSHVFSLANRPVILSIARDITERKLNEHVEKKAFEQIEKNISQLAILGDHIRNPLAVIVALADMDETEHGKQIVEQCAIIDDLITRLDKGWIESENVRNFIRKHYGLS